MRIFFFSFFLSLSLLKKEEGGRLRSEQWYTYVNRSQQSEKTKDWAADDFSLDFIFNRDFTSSTRLASRIAYVRASV